MVAQIINRGRGPEIAGTRITVYDVLSYLASGMTEQELLSDFPELTHEDILACLSTPFAKFDHAASGTSASLLR